MRSRLDTAADTQLKMMFASLIEDEELCLTKDQYDAMVFEAFIAGARAVCSLPLDELSGAQ
ncbi:hypothetical protein EGJ53_15830 [Pseudomonas fluorescens]|nr:hypothetical protein EGJ53_15830 [Pseudomonas fluorescens]